MGDTTYPWCICAGGVTIAVFQVFDFPQTVFVDDKTVIRLEDRAGEGVGIAV